MRASIPGIHVGLEGSSTSGWEDPDKPGILQQTLVIAPGSSWIQLPHHPLLKLSCQLIIFHTFSSLLILANYAEIDGLELSQLANRLPLVR